MRPPNLAWLVFIGWVISYADEWEDYSNYFWEGVEISRISPTSWSFNSALELSWHFWVCHYTDQIEDQGLVLSAILVPFDSNWFMLCPWAMSFFRICALLFSLLLQYDMKIIRSLYLSKVVLLIKLLEDECNHCL